MLPWEYWVNRGGWGVYSIENAGAGKYAQDCLFPLYFRPEALFRSTPSGRRFPHQLFAADGLIDEWITDSTGPAIAIFQQFQGIFIAGVAGAVGGRPSIGETACVAVGGVGAA